jgi:hypothetical protein
MRALQPGKEVCATAVADFPNDAIPQAVNNAVALAIPAAFKKSRRER